jgi:hypothetical protein
MKIFTIPQLHYKLQWRWIIVAFCFFVIFHLVLFFFLYETYRNIFGQNFWSRAVIAFSFLSLISAYLSYRARRLILVECGTAAILYIIMLKLFLPSYLVVPTYLLNLYLVVECAVLGFIFAFCGAGLGRRLKGKYR